MCTPITIEWTTKKQIQLMLFGVKTHSQITDYGCSIVHMVRQAASQKKTHKSGESFQQVSTFFNIPAGSCRYIHTYLVGDFNHVEKYESQWEGLSHILIMENKQC